MAKSKREKQEAALAKLTANIAERMSKGQKATFSQSQEYNALKKALGYSGEIKISEPPKTPEDFMEKIFGKGDPVTGMIWANPLPEDFKPTPELEEIVRQLQRAKAYFVEFQVSLICPSGYRHGTYEGSGHYMSQWVERHTHYIFHHSKHLFGSSLTVVFSHRGGLPSYDEDDRRLGGITKEEYERKRSQRSTDFTVRGKALEVELH